MIGLSGHEQNQVENGDYKLETPLGRNWLSFYFYHSFLFPEVSSAAERLPPVSDNPALVRVPFSSNIALAR